MKDGKLKILFIASLGDISASGWQRLWAMEQCGVEVCVINKYDYKPSFLIDKLTHFFKFSRLLISKKLEKKIQLTLKEFKPDILWLEWPKEVNSSLLLRIKNNMPNLSLVSFIDDNPWGKRKDEKWMWSNYFETIPFFDIHIVKRQGDIDNLRRLGEKFCYLWDHGIYTPLFKPPTPDYPIKYPVSFVGTCFDGREKLIAYLLENKIDIHVFGANWHKKSNLPQRFPNNFHPYVSGQAYVDVIWASGICLGLVSHSNEDEWTMRTYEVPGCSKLLVCESTPTHQQLFSKYHHSLLFTTKEQCLNSLQYFLACGTEADAIAKKIFNDFTNDNKTLDNCMLQFLNSNFAC